MAGKKSKKSAVKTEKKVSSTSTREEKLSDTVKRMEKIVNRNDQGHHLR